MKSNKRFISLLLILVLSISCCAIPEVVCAIASNNNNFGKYIISSSKVGSLIDKYSYEEPVYQFTHSELAPLSSIKKPRYTLNSKGIYRIKGNKNDNSAVLMLTGDLMSQDDQQLAARTENGSYCFNDSFNHVRNIFSSADLVVGNLETMLSESASYYSEEKKVEDKPHCNGPSTYLDALKYAGYDVLVQANNHNCDTGVVGIHQTLSHLNQYGLAHTGLFDDNKEQRFVIVNVDGIKVGILSYAYYYNQKEWHLTEEGQNVCLNRYSKAKAKKDIAKAKKMGAEYIITYLHCGIEYTNEHVSRQEKIAKALANAGADYVVGSHPHALQDFDKIKAKGGRIVPVIYSMGNFVSSMTAHDISKDTIILKLKLKKSRGKVKLVSNTYIPCRTITDYYGNYYCTVPLTADVRKDSNYSDEVNITYNRIKSVLGKKISIEKKYK